MFTRFRHLTAAAILGVAAFAQIAPAEAVPVLRLSTSAGAMVTISDGGAGDVNALAGAVTFVGQVGNWQLNVTTGTTKPFIGSAVLPRMDLNSVNATTDLVAAETLTIEFTEIDFTSPTAKAISKIGGTADGPVTYDVYADAANAIFAQSTLITQIGPSGLGAFSETTGGVLGVAAPFSLTQVVTITHGTGTKLTSMDAEFAVPEPGTLAILGGGLAGFGILRRRQRRKIAA